MYVDAYLLDEQAAYIQRERADAASHARLVRLHGIPTRRRTHRSRSSSG